MKRKILKTLLCLVLIAALSLTAAGISIVYFADTDEKCECDAVIVLGAAMYNGEVSPVFRERINHGIWLYENGFADYIIFTGGFPKGGTMSESRAAMEYALEKGVPEEAIFIEELSTITEENMLYAEKIMEENSFETAIIVSDPLHMRRAMLMAKDYGITAYPSPTPTTMYQSFKTQAPFLMRESFLYIGYLAIRIFR